jgi:hypothetical protein
MHRHPYSFKAVDLLRAARCEVCSISFSPFQFLRVFLVYSHGVSLISMLNDPFPDLWVSACCASELGKQSALLDADKIPVRSSADCMTMSCF